MAITIYRGPDYKAEDYFSYVFEYKVNNDEELKIIEKYFTIFYEYSLGKSFYFRINEKEHRRVKLLIINKSEDYVILKHIIENCTKRNIEDVFGEFLTGTIF